MNKKWLKSCRTILLILFAATILTSCVEDNMNASSKFSDLIEYALDDISLTIYFWNFDATNPRGAHMTVEWLVERAHSYRIVVAGQELAEHRDLLNQLANIELAPSRENVHINARLYYVFEHIHYGEIFSFVGDIFTRSCNVVVLINGIEVESDRIFYEMVFPFLPEIASETLQKQVNGRWPVSE